MGRISYVCSHACSKEYKSYSQKYFETFWFHPSVFAIPDFCPHWNLLLVERSKRQCCLFAWRPGHGDVAHDYVIDCKVRDLTSPPSCNFDILFCFFSFMSAITLLGTPAEIYQFGTQYITLVLSYPFVIGSTIVCYLPVFYKLGVSTSYEVTDTWLFLTFKIMIAKNL